MKNEVGDCMVKKIILIAGSANTRDFLVNQLREFIFDRYTPEAYAE